MNLKSVSSEKNIAVLIFFSITVVTVSLTVALLRSDLVQIRDYGEQELTTIKEKFIRLKENEVKRSVDQLVDFINNRHSLTINRPFNSATERELWKYCSAG